MANRTACPADGTIGSTTGPHFESRQSMQREKAGLLTRYPHDPLDLSRLRILPPPSSARVSCGAYDEWVRSVLCADGGRSCRCTASLSIQAREQRPRCQKLDRRLCSFGHKQAQLTIVDRMFHAPSLWHNNHIRMKSCR